VRGKSSSTDIATFIATAGYVGFVPVAPGTFGSAVGLAIYAIVRTTGSQALEAAILVVVLLAGLWSASCVERDRGKDPGVVVIDEVLGMLVTLAFLNVTVIGALVGFFLFRALDVVKPYPAGRFEHLPGGAGIMLDDVMAGVYSNLAIRAVTVFLPGTLA
jgi:phosphatidylglycerophosphatase A